MIIIQATNVHSGGGAVLLEALLNSCLTGNLGLKLYVDARFPLSEPWKKSFEIVQVPNTVISRLKVEFMLKSDAAKYKEGAFFFFGNLPPLFSSAHNSNLFFQNSILLPATSKFPFSIKTRLKHGLERIWLRSTLRNVKTVFVQSDSLKRSFMTSFSGKDVRVFAFADTEKRVSRSLEEFDFLYVASGDPHKNHLNLFKAWIYLHERGIEPKLTITASSLGEQESKLYEEALKRGVKIDRKSDLSHAAVLAIYRSAKALIFPSFTESFGLPLLEAQTVGLPILASELDYVRDLVVPAETFDPKSEVSIARAVQRFLHIDEAARTTVKSANEFIRELISKV